MIRTALYFICSAAAAAFLLLSCAKEEKELTVADQEAAIESYINQNFSQYYIVRRGGSNRIIVDTTVVGATDSLEYGDSLYFYYAGYTFTSSPSSLFSTNNEYLATESGFSLSDQDFSIKKVHFTPGAMISGLENGLYGVKDGEHCVILFSAKYGFYDDYVYNIPKLSALAFEIWVEDVVKNNR